MTDLLIDPVVGNEWLSENQDKKRFFLVGATQVMTMIPKMRPNNCAQYFFDAADVIADETTWTTDYPFNYVSSNVQLRPKNIFKPRTFGKTVATIVGFELAARALAPHVNVYEHLRILSGEYFVDGYTKERLEQLRRVHASWDQAAREEKFGKTKSSSTFDIACNIYLGQFANPNPLSDMSEGFCATEYVCHRLKEFVQRHYPQDLHLGEVLRVGQPGGDQISGSKNASERVRVPKTLANLTIYTPAEASGGTSPPGQSQTVVDLAARDNIAPDQGKN
ncbi:MAG: hypothetical protein WDN03_02245 [Rhizomicrobium sp.]